MNKFETIGMTAILGELLEILYTKQNRYYFVNIYWASNNTNISIKEKDEDNTLFDVDIEGEMDTYNFLVKKITNLVANNLDSYGCLSTKRLDENKKIDIQIIKTSNLEISLPIYNKEQLIQAEYINNLMLNNIERKNNIKQRVYIK